MNMTRNNKILQEAIILLIIILLSAAVILIFSSSTSPFYPYNYGIDSAFNRFVGLNILRKKILYKDIWDHKGPLLFLIQAVGAIGGTRNNGPSFIFFLQIFSLSISLFFCRGTYKAILSGEITYKKELIFIASGILSLLVYIKTIEGGNLNEEWCLPFICCSFYLFAQYSYSGKVDHPQLISFIHGLCCGVITFIRVNNAVSLFCGLAVIFISLIKERKWKNIGLNILFWFFGFSLITVPVIVYFASNDALYDMFYAVFLHNLKYMAKETHSNLSFNDFLIRYLPIALSFVLIISSFLHSKTKDLFDMILLSAAAGSAVMLFYSNTYLHYFTIFVPVFLLVLLKYFPFTGKIGAATAAGLVILFLSIYLFPLPGRIDRSVYSYVSSIPKEEKNSMIAIWTSPEIYLNSGLMPVSRFSSYQYKYFAVNKEMEEEFVSDLSAARPLRIMVLSGYKDRLDPEIKLLLENSYSFEITDGDADIYVLDGQ